MKSKKLAFPIIILLLGITCLGIYSTSHQIFSYGITQLSNDHDNILQTNAIIDNIIGNCSAGIHSLYVHETSNLTPFQNTNNFTIEYPANKSLSTFEHKLNLTKLAFTVTAMTKPFERLVVANETTNSTTATDETVEKLAQEFRIENTSQVKGFAIYLNFSTILSIFSFGFLNIYRADDIDGGRINAFDMIIYLPDTNNTWKGRWFNFSYDNLLPKGNYFVVFYVRGGALVPPKNNSWRIQNYTNPSYNKGASMMFRNSTGWANITDDATADFLMQMEIARYVVPEEVNLTCYANDDKLNLTHYEEPNPGFLRFPWSTYVEYYVPAPLQDDLKFNLTVNETLGYGLVWTDYRYIKFLDAVGNYTASSNQRRWTVNYTSINSSSDLVNQLTPVYIYPLDWSISKFYDRFDQEIIEFGIMFSKIYDKTYHGIYYPDYGDGYQTFTFRAEFSSPNYVTKINPQIDVNGSFQYETSFIKGDTMRIQALIQDSDNNNVTTGNCSIYLYNSSNDLVFSENITVVNSTVNSNNIPTTNYTAGDYDIIVTWTNGSEVGFDSFIISIQNQTIPFIPPEEKPIGAYVAATAMILGPQEPILLYIITTVLVVITAMVGGLIARRKMQERNWEKSLLHLFIMNKDGRAMYDYSFGIEQKDPTLISGMLTALTSFVKETIGSKKQLKTIDQEDKKIILGHGTYSTVAVFAEKDLPIMHHKASEFLKTFEDSYSGKIKQWDGSTAVFKRVNKIVEKYFPTSAEDQIIRSIGRELLGFKESIISTTDPKEIFGLLQLATKLTEKYQEIIREHYNKEYGEILKIVNEKIKSSE